MNLQSKAISIRKRLSNYARENNFVYQNVETSFLLERLVVRITSSKKLQNNMIFKGGYVGLRVYDSGRYTTDIDAIITSPETHDILITIRNEVEKASYDAVWFRFEKDYDLKTQDKHGGVRQTYRAGIGKMPENTKRSQKIDLDMSVGDPVIPPPLEITTAELIGDGELGWHVYSLELMAAEKIHALVDRGNYNSRSKDVFDLHQFLPKSKAKNLQQAIETCFNHRQTELPRNLAEHIQSTNTTRLKQGWTSAVSTVKNPPSFEQAYQTLVSELRRLQV